MPSFLLKKRSRKSFKEGLRALRFSTRENYQASIHKFDKFCKYGYDGRKTEDIVNELKSLEPEQRDEAYLDLLQDFVNWLVNSQLANSTVNMYLQIIIYFFSYCGIRAHPQDLRQHVKRPKKIKEKLHPLKKEEILRIFEHIPLQRQMLYLTLLGNGMRIQETVALRRRDFDLDYPKRIKIEIPAIFTKALTSHTTFVTKEAESFLRPHLESLEDNGPVFATNPNPFHAKMTEIEAFSRYRRRAGLTQQYPSSNRHFITLHSFRSYFFTRARRVHDTDLAHAMVGHSTYLDMYDRKEGSEKLGLFVRVEPKLKILN